MATSEELSSLKTLVKAERARREHQIGATRVARLEVHSVDLRNIDPTAGNVATVEIDVCWSVATVDIVD